MRKLTPTIRYAVRDCGKAFFQVFVDNTPEKQERVNTKFQFLMNLLTGEDQPLRDGLKRDITRLDEEINAFDSGEPSANPRLAFAKLLFDLSLITQQELEEETFREPRYEL